MEFIKNFHLISDKIPNIREKDFKLITNVIYYIDYNDYYDEVSFLEVVYILEPEYKSKKYKLVLKFNDITSLNLSGFGGPINQIMGFKITDMRERKWESGQRYYVHDYENDIMSFYCSSIEALSIKEL